MSEGRNTRELLDEIGELLSLLDASLDGASAEPDFHLDGQGRVLDASMRASELLGVVRSALVGRPLGTVADVSGSWAPGESVELRIRGRRYRGLLSPVAGAADDVMQLSLTALDLERAAAGNDERLALMVHDLANVLGVIRGHAELTRMLADEAVVEAMDEILRAVDRGEALLRGAQARPEGDAGEQPGDEPGLS